MIRALLPLCSGCLEDRITVAKNTVLVVPARRVVEYRATLSLGYATKQMQSKLQGGEEMRSSKTAVLSGVHQYTRNRCINLYRPIGTQKVRQVALPPNQLFLPALVRRAYRVGQTGTLCWGPPCMAT